MNELELAKACADQMFSNDHASRSLGMAVEVIEAGSVVVRMTVRQDMLNGHGICHGGFIFTLADSAFAFACNSYNDVSVVSGADIDFLHMADLGDELVATATESHRGRRTGVYDVVVKNQKEELIAVFRGRSVTLGRPVLPQ